MAYTGEQKREYQRKWLAKRRADWLANKYCVICGSVDNLEVDHINRDTKVTHSVWSWSAARREIELAKCQVLCHAHHLEKTIKENSGPEHGTHGRYVRGCRCTKCTEAHKLLARERRANNKSW